MNNKIENQGNTIPTQAKIGMLLLVLFMPVFLIASILAFL